jgi:hypothetical protein
MRLLVLWYLIALELCEMIAGQAPSVSIDLVKTRTAASKAATDAVSIVYFKWSTDRQGLFQPGSVQLCRWCRLARGEFLEVRYAKDGLRRIFGSDGAVRIEWVAEVGDSWASVRLAAIQSLRELPDAYICYDGARIVSWTRRPPEKWLGILRNDGDVFSVRDQYHLALGMDHRRWLHEVDWESTESTTVLEDGELTSLVTWDANEDVTYCFSFDDRRLLKRFRFWYGGRDAGEEGRRERVLAQPGAWIDLRDDGPELDGFVLPGWIASRPMRPGRG